MGLGQRLGKIRPPTSFGINLGRGGGDGGGNESEEAADPQRLEATSTPLITCVAGADASGRRPE